MEAFSHDDKSFNLGDHARCYM